MDERMSLTTQAAHYVKAALRTLGTDVLTARPPTDSDAPEAVGAELLQLIFADRVGHDDFDEQLAALARHPDGQAALGALERLISHALEDDPEVAAAALGTLAAFYRRRADAGSVQALADLGNLLRREGDFVGAKATYQQAIDAGRHETLISMAHLLRVTDNAAARACLDQAIAVGDPDLTPLALITLSTVLAWSEPERGDPAGAESALLQAIETSHPDFAPEAMSLLGSLRERQVDAEGARAAYRQAIDTGHAEWADRSRHELAYMLKEEGDLAGAREQYERLVSNGNERWASEALESLAILLQDDGDVDGLRALHQTAVQTGNWSAPEVLVMLGFLLEQRGDDQGARAALQQAIDDGYHGADWLIEKLHPSPKPTAAELDALPPRFDPRNIRRTGAYSRDDDGWTPHRYVIGMSDGYDPIANPGSLRDLGGSAMVTGGGTETQLHGRASPAVKHIALIQDGREDRRPLESHFGFWVVSTEECTPFRVEGRDAGGNVLARISYDPDDQRRADTTSAECS
jgi:tetratricopeptide (TPR) repeat protein